MLALIPARGGSKGIPGKNIKEIAGQPLIHWTIDAALAAKHISRVVISTDSQDIADVCLQRPVEIPFLRPQELASDTALAIDNYLYTIARLNDELEQQISEFVVLLPTTPLRTSSDIDNAIELYRSKNADSVISGTKTHPLSWNFELDNDGKIKPPQVATRDAMNRQSGQPQYVPNGAIYVLNFAALQRNYAYYSEKSYCYLMQSNNSVDIDDMDDFTLAELLLKQRQGL